MPQLRTMECTSARQHGYICNNKGGRIIGKSSPSPTPGTPENGRADVSQLQKGGVRSTNHCTAGVALLAHARAMSGTEEPVRLQPRSTEALLEDTDGLLRLAHP